MTPDQITSLLAQAPIVLALVYILNAQSKAHTDSITYYRSQIEKLQNALIKPSEKAAELSDHLPG